VKPAAAPSVVIIVLFWKSHNVVSCVVFWMVSCCLGCTRQAGVPTLYIESICDDPKVLDSNLRTKIAHSPDYKNMPIELAMKVWGGAYR